MSGGTTKDGSGNDDSGGAGSKWPGRATRAPRLRDYGYLLLKPLAAQLSDALARHFGGRRDLAVLDLGCDHKPYFPLFEPYARRYVGLDVARTTPQVDVVGGASATPFASGRFDAVLCSQVLEHVPDPMVTVKEIARLLKPGGRVLLSTHGTFIYHPHPTDFWRWTQEGLTKLFTDSGCFEEIELHANGGTGHCLAYLFAVYVHLGMKRKWLRPLRKLLIPLVNLWGLVLGRMLRRFDHPAPHSLIANFLVVARRR
jgi:SAM-dependent methyltransferase